MNKAAAVFFVLMAMNAAAFAQVRIETHSGAGYVGWLIEETQDSLVLRLSDSTDRPFQKSDIRKFDRTFSSRNNHFFLGGLAVGMPAAINLILGHEWREFGVRLSGGYLGGTHGAQVNVTKRLSRSSTKNFNLSVGAGYSRLSVPKKEPVYFFGTQTGTRTTYEINMWRYGSLEIDGNWGGFFVSGGLCAGSGSFTNPQLTFQIGYVQEFR